MPHSRLLPPLALVAAALLALTACSSGTVAGPPSDAPVAEVARTTVTVPGSGPAGDHTDARGAFAGPDGTTLVVLAGADATRGDDSAPGAAVAVVGADGTTVPASAELAPGSRPDTAYGWQGQAVVAGLVWPGTGPIGYGLQVVDSSTGTPGAPLPVAVPGDVSLTGSAAALGPDGVLYVAVSRSGGAPVLLAVDPATGAVRASAEVGVDGVAPSPAEVADLVIAPDGSRVVLTVTAPGAERFAPSRTLLVTVDSDLAPLRAPVDLAPGFVRSLAVDAVVATDGTVYAVVRGSDADRVDREYVVAVGPDATAPTVLTGDDFRGTPVTEVALDGTTLWVTLQQEADTASVLAVDTRTGEVGAPLGLCDEMAGRLLVGASGTVAVAAQCDGEAVLWWLDPR